MKRTAMILVLFLLAACQPATPTPVTPKAPPVPTSTPQPDFITDAKGVPMRLVSAGPFMMGSDTGTGDAKPAHSVILPDFYMDVYEVTRARYKECVTAGACAEVRNVPNVETYYADPTFPMSAISWDAASAYCQWRAARLPSEAEWEKAARGTDGRTYPWGATLDATYADFGPSAGPSVVGSHPANVSPYGMFDMAGNLWEWTADAYLPYPGYQGDQSFFRPADRVLRGGSSYGGDPSSLSTWFRYVESPGVEVGYIGFRCTKNANANP